MTIHEELAHELYRGHQERSLPAWAAERVQERAYRARVGRSVRSAKTATLVEGVRADQAIGCIV